MSFLGIISVKISPCGRNDKNSRNDSEGNVVIDHIGLGKYLSTLADITE